MSYKIQFSFQAEVRDFVSDEPVSLQVAELSIGEGKIENYLPVELAARGIVGGEVFLTAGGANARVNVVYWAPDEIDDAAVEKLLAATIDQITDGLGEGGFAFHRDERLLVALADDDAPPARSVVRDSREVLAAPRAAVAARAGDLEGLKAALVSEPARIDAPFQGYSALHYALLYGHPALAELLIKAGADVNCLDPQGSSPLMACASAQGLNDEQSEALAQLLIDKGARIQLRDDAGRTAKSLAELRRKSRLAALLQ